MRVKLFLGRAIQNHAYFLQRDQAALNHAIQARQNLIDAFRGFYNFKNDGQVLRKPKNFVGVINAGAAVTGHAAQHGHARKAFLAQQFDNRFIKRLAMSFVGLADVNAHQCPLALKSFVRHVSSDMECGGLAAALTASAPRLV